MTRLVFGIDLPPVITYAPGIPCPTCQTNMRGGANGDSWYCPNCGLTMCDCFIKYPDNYKPKSLVSGKVLCEV
jgi:predicted RNA-binding Zn-ribbon protein involved in translation (DUF1610 family)